MALEKSLGVTDLLEYEMKFMLSHEEYRILFEAFNVPSYTQTNFYYDTQDLFYNRNGITCRIREKENRYNATIKTHRLKTQHCSEERSRNVTNECDVSLFEGMELFLQGKMQTIRKDILMPNGVRISIDKNTYLGIEDYELEIEYNPAFENHCKEALHTIIVVLSEQNIFSSVEEFYNRMKHSLTKSERFFAQKATNKEMIKNAICSE